MSRYSFYLPECNQLTGLSVVDWEFLCELAAENNIPPATFAAQMIASELAQVRDQSAYFDRLQQQTDSLAMCQEKQLEEVLS